MARGASPAAGTGTPGLRPGYTLSPLRGFGLQRLFSYGVSTPGCTIPFPEAFLASATILRTSARSCFAS